MNVAAQRMKEKVFLVVVDFRERNAWSPDDIRDEMQELVTACNGFVVDSMICVLKIPGVQFFV